MTNSPTRAELLVAAAIRWFDASGIELSKDFPEILNEMAADPARCHICTGEIEAARALLGDGWQPIETAPRGKVILLFGITDRDPLNWKMATGAQANDGGDWWWDGHVLDKPHHHRPTHWHPLPAPPSEKSNADKESGT